MPNPNPTSVAGRTISFTPVAGAQGFITVNGVNLNLEAWTPSIQANPIDVTNFNSPTDGNGLVHEEFIFGTVTGTFDLKGPFDTGAIAYFPKAGDTGTGVFGYTGGYTYSITFGVVSVSSSTSVKGRAEFSINVKANGLITKTPA